VIRSDHLLEIAEDGIEASANDPANVARYDIRLPEEACLDFSATPGTADLMSSDLAKALEDAAAGPEVRFFRSDDKAWVVEDGPAYWTVTKEANATNLGDPPPVEFGTEIEVRAGPLQRVFAGEIDADKANIELNALHALDIRVPNDGMTNSLKTDDAEIVRGPPATAAFSPDYVRDVIRAFKPDTTLTIEMNDEHPVRISATECGVKVEYYIAPKIRT